MSGRVPLGLLVDLNDPNSSLIHELCSSVENPFTIHEDDPFGLTAGQKEEQSLPETTDKRPFQAFAADGNDVDVLVKLSDSPKAKPVASGSSPAASHQFDHLSLMDEARPKFACDILEDWEAIAQEAMHLAADFENNQLSPIKIADLLIQPDSSLLTSSKKLRDFLSMENGSDLESTSPSRPQASPKKENPIGKKEETKTKVKKELAHTKRRSLEPRSTKTSSKRASLSVPIKATPPVKKVQKEVKEIPGTPKIRSKLTSAPTASYTENRSHPVIRRNLMNPPPSRAPAHAHKSNAAQPAGPLKAAPLPSLGPTETSITSAGSISSISTPSSVGSISANRMKFSGLPNAASTPSIPKLATPSRFSQLPLLRTTSDLTKQATVPSSSIHSLHSSHVTLNSSLGIPTGVRRSLIPNPAPRVPASQLGRSGSLRLQPPSATETKGLAEPGTIKPLVSVPKPVSMKPKSVIQPGHKENVRP